MAERDIRMRPFTGRGTGVLSDGYLFVGDHRRFGIVWRAADALDYRVDAGRFRKAVNA